MPLSGGRSTIAGVDFEAWVVALKCVDVFFDGTLKVTPQASTSIDPQTLERKVVSIDDIHISSPQKDEFYNIKYNAPSDADSWRLGELKQQKVLAQLKAQYQKTPRAILYFVSQSPCPLFKDILPRTQNCSSRKELEIELAPNKYIKDWDNLKEELSFSDEELICFSKQIKTQRFIDIEEIEQRILERLREHVSNVRSAPLALHKLAFEAGKTGKVIDQLCVISHLEKYDIHPKAHLKPEILLEQIRIASASLYAVSATFFNNCHIDRQEVQKLLDWVQQPLPENKPPIAVLTGKAGSGKSVILQNVLKKLQEEKTPVLGIKADIQSDLRIIELKEGIKSTLASLVEQYGRAVVLFDQIDALSLSASTDRQFLNAYLNQIHQCSQIHGLRIIISCRTYDLKTDPFLQSLDNILTIEVGDLQQQEVFSVLSQLEITPNQISPKLLELLKVPLHLRAFADIYDENVDLKAITTLQDLYDNLWEQRILSSSNWEMVIEALEMITDIMDTSKSLFVSSTVKDRNNIGVQHLLCQSLLVPSSTGKQLQFFHQTFFDYCYARTFLKRHISLIGVILQQHQGLFVRSQVKQVLNYLRRNDPQIYLRELQAFLTHQRLQFHLRLLVINQLAFLDDPIDEEWRIVKLLLDSDPEFTLHFLEAIQNEAWLKYLIQYGYLHKFLTSPDDVLFGYTRWKLQALIDTCTEIIVNFLEDFPAIEKRDEQIAGILINLAHWENSKVLQLFERYLPTIKTFPDSYHYYRILKSVFPFQPERICQIFFDDIHRKIEAIPSADEFDKRKFLDHHEIDLFQNIREHEKTKDTALSEGILAVRQLVEKTRFNSKSNFYHDGAFLFFEKFGAHLHNHWVFFAFIKEDLIATALKNKRRFLELTAGFETSYALTLLRLLIQGYLTNPDEYVQEGFALLSRPGILAEIIDEDSGGYEVRSLLRQLYPLFSQAQQETINALILSIQPEWEHFQRRGFSKYRVLCAIPNDALKQHPAIAKIYDELKRKFAAYEERPPEICEVVQVGPPLPEKAYEKMTPEQWIASFKRYNESTKWDQPGKDFLKGGIIEHSRAFTEQVSQRPEALYDFVATLRERDDIPLMYAEAGINGLVKAQYDFEKVKAIIKRYWRFSDSGFRRAIIWAIDYINKQDALDLGLIEILEEYALHDPDPEQESWMIDAGGGTPYYAGDPLNSGINTVRGAAASRLAIHGYKTSYPEKVFEIMRQIADDPAVSVRCCLIADLHGMLRWDRGKTHQIFMSLTHDFHPHIIKYGLPCLAYLLNEENFLTFIPHLKIVIESGYEPEYVGQIFMLAYARNYPQSQELLEKGFQISSHIKAGAIEFAARQLLERNQNVAEKSKAIYLRFLDEDSKEISEMYDHIFYQFEPLDFNALYDLIVAYTQSESICHNEGHRFFDYLMKCVDIEPEKCIDLIHNYLSHDFSKSQRRAFAPRDTHIQILIGAYNKLRDETYKEKAMDIFDQMLQDQMYKRDGLNVLTEYDRG